MDQESADVVRSYVGKDYGKYPYDGEDLDFFQLHSRKHDLDAPNGPRLHYDNSTSTLNEKLWRSHLEGVANQEVRAKIDTRLGEIAAEITLAKENKKRFRPFKPDPELLKEKGELRGRKAFIEKRDEALGSPEWNIGQAEKLVERHGEELYQEALDDARDADVPITNSASEKQPKQV
jgi:hypothetical protein